MEVDRKFRKSYRMLIKKMKEDPEIDSSGRICGVTKKIKPFTSPYDSDRAELSNRIVDIVNTYSDRSIKRWQELDRIPVAFIKEQSLLDEYNRPIKKTIVFDVSKNKYYYKREVE